MSRLGFAICLLSLVGMTLGLRLMFVRADHAFASIISEGAAQ